MDALLASDRDVDFETIGLDLVILAVYGASELRLAILDVCRVRDEVSRLTGGKQVPFTYGSLSSQVAY